MINNLRMKEGFNVINFQMDDKIPYVQQVLSSLLLEFAGKTEV
jgi:hypothetical protein